LTDRRLLAWVAPAAVVLATALTACGTMEPNSSFSQSGFVASGSGSTSNVSGITGPGTNSNTNTGTNSNTNSGTNTNTNSGANTNTNSGANTNTNTGTNSNTNSGTNTNTNSGTNTNTNTGGQANFASDVGVTATSITIGNITGVSGALGPNAFGVTLSGLRIWVDSINAQGGINGRKVILDSCDDGQDASQNVACTQSLTPKVFAYIANNSLSSSGSAHSEYTAGVPDIGFPLNNGYYKYPNMFSLYGTDYPRNGTQVGFKGNLENTPGIYRWFALNRGIKRAGYFFYSETSSQQQGYAAEVDAAPYGIKNVYEGGGHSGENLAAPNFDGDVVSMMHMGANKPQALFDAMDVNGNQKLCQSMDRYGFSVVAKVSTIEVWDQSIGTPAWSKPCRDSIYVATNSLSYADSSQPQVAAYLSAFNTYAPGGTLQAEWTFQGYAVGQMFADDVASMGANVTRKGFISWLDKLPGVTSPDAYTDHGIFSPLSYQVDNPSTPRPDCATIAQWQDSAGTFVTRAPLTTCFQDPLIASPSTPDGS
jgi:branched-chain amino acid transport system substrate-binding protein